MVNGNTATVFCTICHLCRKILLKCHFQYGPDLKWQNKLRNSTSFRFYKLNEIILFQIKHSSAESEAVNQMLSSISTFRGGFHPPDWNTHLNWSWAAFWYIFLSLLSSSTHPSNSTSTVGLFGLVKAIFNIACLFFKFFNTSANRDGLLGRYTSSKKIDTFIP